MASHRQSTTSTGRPTSGDAAAAAKYLPSSPLAMTSFPVSMRPISLQQQALRRIPSELSVSSGMVSPSLLSPAGGGAFMSASYESMAFGMDSMILHSPMLSSSYRSSNPASPFLANPQQQQQQPLSAASFQLSFSEDVMLMGASGGGDDDVFRMTADGSAASSLPSSGFFAFGHGGGTPLTPLSGLSGLTADRSSQLSGTSGTDNNNPQWGIPSPTISMEPYADSLALAMQHQHGHHHFDHHYSLPPAPTAPPPHLVTSRTSMPPPFRSDMVDLDAISSPPFPTLLALPGNDSLSLRRRQQALLRRASSSGPLSPTLGGFVDTVELTCMPTPPIGSLYGSAYRSMHSNGGGLMDHQGGQQQQQPSPATGFGSNTSALYLAADHFGIPQQQSTTSASGIGSTLPYLPDQFAQLYPPSPPVTPDIQYATTRSDSAAAIEHARLSQSLSPSPPPLHTSAPAMTAVPVAAAAAAPRQRVRNARRSGLSGSVVSANDSHVNGGDAMAATDSHGSLSPTDSIQLSLSPPPHPSLTTIVSFATALTAPTPSSSSMALAAPVGTPTVGAGRGRAARMRKKSTLSGLVISGDAEGLAQYHPYAPTSPSSASPTHAHFFSASVDGLRSPASPTGPKSLPKVSAPGHTQQQQLATAATSATAASAAAMSAATAFPKSKPRSRMPSMLSQSLTGTDSAQLVTDSTDPEKPYRCTECGMDYKRKADCVRHARMHTGEKPYVCGCGQAFARQDALRRHMAKGASGTCTAPAAAAGAVAKGDGVVPTASVAAAVTKSVAVSSSASSSYLPPKASPPAPPLDPFQQQHQQQQQQQQYCVLSPVTPAYDLSVMGYFDGTTTSSSSTATSRASSVAPTTLSMSMDLTVTPDPSSSVGLHGLSALDEFMMAVDHRHHHQLQQQHQNQQHEYATYHPHPPAAAAAERSMSDDPFAELMIPPGVDVDEMARMLTAEMLAP